MSGVFIVVEGAEGAGKTTLVERLGARLRRGGRTVTQVREPGGTPGAETLRTLALHSEYVWSAPAELFLMLAARAELVHDVIEPGLAAGSVVLSDRFDHSTMAYQVAGRGLDGEGVRAANRLATGGLTPHLTLVLDVDADVGRSRQAVQGKPPDRMERADAQTHQRVAQAFRSFSGPGIVHLDATQSIDEVADAAWREVERVLRELAGAAQG